LRRTIGWYLDNSGWIDHIRSGAYSAWIDEQYGCQSVNLAATSRK